MNKDMPWAVTIRHRRRLLAAGVGLLVVVGGCGGGSGSAGPGAAATATTAAATPIVSSDGGAAGSEAPAAPVNSDPPAAGGPAGDVCALVNADELEGILGVPVALTVIAGPPDTCDVQSTDGAPLAAFVLTNMDGVSASFVYDAFAASSTAEAISGIGEKAAYDPSQGALVTLKNAAVLSVAVFDDGSGSTDEATRLDQMKRIAAAAAGRM